MNDGLPAYRDAHEAHRLGMAQLDFYRRLTDEEPHVMLVTNQSELNAVCAAWGWQVRRRRFAAWQRARHIRWVLCCSWRALTRSSSQKR